MSADRRPVFCADCGHRSHFHYPNGPHRCVIDGCNCERFVSPEEGREVAKHIREWLVLAAMVTL